MKKITVKTFAKCLILVCGAAVFGWTALSSAQSKTPVVPYPEGYRRWVHVKSEVVHPEHPAFKRFGGIHHIYANEKALEGYKTGKFADGSIIVFDLLEAPTKDGSTKEGSRRAINVMHKNAKRYADTGGWGYEEFRGDSRTERTVAEKAKTECFACHAGQKDRDFVFSFFRE